MHCLIVGGRQTPKTERDDGQNITKLERFRTLQGRHSVQHDATGQWPSVDFAFLGLRLLACLLRRERNALPLHDLLPIILLRRRAAGGRVGKTECRLPRLLTI